MVEKKTIWQSKSTNNTVKVLDSGVWILDLDSRQKRTIALQDFLTNYEQKELKVKNKIKTATEIIDNSNSSDHLNMMFDLQEDFQGIVGNKDKIYKKNVNNPFIVESTICLIDELMEALRETPWKNWKSNQKLDLDKMKTEIIDAWHFLINLSMAANMHSEDIFKEFVKKNEINRERQRERNV